MTSSFIDRRGSALCVNPIQQHTFSGDEFLCDKCQQPRALHYRDGFIPSHAPSRLPTELNIRYRGPHPHFMRPGQYNPDVPPPSDNVRRFAARIRAIEAQQLARALTFKSRSLTGRT